ncbi:class I SAM-dependent methyltransferase [Jannaschia sp. KMU-145]|uniref:class I SAM-dependent methyltransferase n=1 Tax=Jannaschia halovivens TaxID=3388667 RepID=UPI00396B0F4F
MTATTPTAFWNRIAPGYALKPIADPDAYEATLARTLAYLHTDDMVIELGAGTGGTALRLAGAVRSYWATDIAPAMIEIARERVWDASPSNVTLGVEEPGSDAFLGVSVDAVLAFNLFHLLPDPEAGLAHVARMVRPGGTFISKTPCLAGLGWRTPVYRTMIAAMRLFGAAPSVTFMDVRAWHRMIRRAGFEIVEAGDYPAAPPNRFVVARRIL